MADHNDPNAVNTIFSDVDVSAADLYDIFGFPSADHTHGESVVMALTFAAVPKAGELDADMLYRMRMAPDTRIQRTPKEDHSLEGLLTYVDGVKDKYESILHPFEVRVSVDVNQKASIRFINFPGGSFSQTIDTNQVTELTAPGGQTIKVYIGGRDDAFFNDLPGFFRSINYAPQFYHVPHTMTDARELKIPKTLLELEGNDLFNSDPAFPDWGHGFKKDLPVTPLTWSGDRFKKDAEGNYQFVYSGKDAQAGKNINAIILEVPLTYLTATPEVHRIVNVWGESWVRKAAGKVEDIPDHPLLLEHPWSFVEQAKLDEELKAYKLVDTDGQAFADAALSERENSRQMGANNFWLAPHFVKRLGHLGWGFGPSISALGVATAFDHDNSPVSVYKTYDLVVEAFPRVQKLLFQELNMPDDSWNPKKLNIPLRRPVEIFIPNVCSIDMDTTGTWPFGRRPEDQVATRFLSLFLDMTASFKGIRYHVDIMNNQALWDAVPIQPKTPPNPLQNDKAFLPDFPYIAAPW
ncbi:DUF4331 family protein [Granulicella sibirica]|uniref:Uncharacterized protein n=1 Tax=Granulicella sibirica TaxID=2479048 RepID=A0A4Q0ST63_9BACT|nr:DUF4331 family protein [Granulicella sibirica]RXH54113.1 hypothetical protein GRAN_4764 [Granulicella sibirica]